MIKYLVYPDYVVSKNDNDKHFISASSLIKLYNVSREECKIITSESDLNGLKGTFFILRPKYNGDYEINKCKKIYLN